MLRGRNIICINGTNLIIQSKFNGTATTLKSVAFTAATGTAYNIHFRAAGKSNMYGTL